jgi:hypothetical protein
MRRKINKNKNKIRRVPARGTMRRTTIPRPPPTVQTYRIKQKIAFYANAAITKGAVQRVNLLNMIQMATTTTQFARVLQSIRIIRLDVWSITSTATNPIGNSLEVDIQWESTRGPAATISSLQMGIEPGSWSTSPPPESLASYWSQSTSDEAEVLFFVSLPISAIMHVTFEAYVNCGNFAAITNGGSGLTVGGLYTKIAVGGGAGQLVPVDMLSF